jgi:hypothetical protein
VRRDEPRRAGCTSDRGVGFETVRQLLAKGLIVVLLEDSTPPFRGFFLY